MKRHKNKSAGITTIVGALGLLTFAAAAGNENLGLLSGDALAFASSVESCLRHGAAAALGEYSCETSHAVGGARFLSARMN